MEHLEGSPQGPSLSLGSGIALAPFASAGFVDFWVFFALVSAFTSSPFAVPFVGPSSQKLTLLTAFPKDSP